MHEAQAITYLCAGESLCSGGTTETLHLCGVEGGAGEECADYESNIQTDIIRYDHDAAIVDQVMPGRALRVIRS